MTTLTQEQLAIIHTIFDCDPWEMRMYKHKTAITMLGMMIKDEPNSIKRMALQSRVKAEQSLIRAINDQDTDRYDTLSSALPHVKE